MTPRDDDDPLFGTFAGGDERRRRREEPEGRGEVEAPDPPASDYDPDDPLFGTFAPEAEPFTEEQEDLFQRAVDRGRDPVQEPEGPEVQEPEQRESPVDPDLARRLLHEEPERIEDPEAAAPGLFPDIAEPAERPEPRVERPHREDPEPGPGPRLPEGVELEDIEERVAEGREVPPMERAERERLDPDRHPDAFAGFEQDLEEARERTLPRSEAVVDPAQVQARREHVRELPLGERAAHMALQPLVGLTEIVSSSLEGTTALSQAAVRQHVHSLADAAERIDRELPEWAEELGEREAEERAAARLGGWLRETVGSWSPLSEDPIVAERMFLSQLPAAFGSFGGYGLLSRGLMTALGAGAGSAGAMATAGVGGAGRMYREAREAGATEEEAQRSAVLGVPGGVAQTLGPTSLASRLYRFRTGRWPQPGTDAPVRSAGVRGAVEEAGAEGTGQFLFNAAARVFDDERQLLQDVPQAATVGAIAGGAFGAATTRASRWSMERELEAAEADLRHHQELLEQGIDNDGQPLTDEGRRLLGLIVEGAGHEVSALRHALGRAEERDQEEAAREEEPVAELPEPEPERPSPLDRLISPDARVDPAAEAAPGPVAAPQPSPDARVDPEPSPEPAAAPEPSSVPVGEDAVPGPARAPLEALQGIREELDRGLSQAAPQVGEEQIARAHFARRGEQREELIREARTRLGELEPDQMAAAMEQIRDEDPGLARALEGRVWAPEPDADGFDAETFFHGTDVEGLTELRAGPQGLFVTPSRDHAEAYQREAPEGQVHEVQIQPGRPYSFRLGEEGALQPADAFEQGFDSWVQLTPDGAEVLQAAVASPEQIRPVGEPAAEPAPAEPSPFVRGELARIHAAPEGAPEVTYEGEAEGAELWRHSRAEAEALPIPQDQSVPQPVRWLHQRVDEVEADPELGRRWQGELPSGMATAIQRWARDAAQDPEQGVVFEDRADSGWRVNIDRPYGTTNIRVGVRGAPDEVSFSRGPQWSQAALEAAARGEAVPEPVLDELRAVPGFDQLVERRRGELEPTPGPEAPTPAPEAPAEPAPTPSRDPVTAAADPAARAELGRPPLEVRSPRPVPGNARPVRELEDGSIPLRTDAQGNPVTPVVMRGDPQEVILPDGGRVPVTYGLADVSGALPSHDPFTFQPNEHYPAVIQDRRYHRDPAAQEEVRSRSAALDPQLMLTPSNRATEGTPIIREDGPTLSGNQRLMMLLLAREQHPDRYEAYVDELPGAAERVGMEGEEVAGMVDQIIDAGGVPGLVRVLEVPVESKTELGRLMSEFNETGTKARDPLGEAQVRANRLREAGPVLRHLERTMDPETTIRSYLGTAAGRDFFELLVQHDVIRRSDAGELMRRRDRMPNEEGRTAVERLLLSAAVRDAEVVDMAPPSWLGKIEKAVPAILEAQRAPGWDLTPTLQEALMLGAQVQATEGARSVVDITGQMDLTGQAASPEGEALARFLETQGPRQVAEALRRYGEISAEAREQAQSEDLFGTPPADPREWFASIFEAPAPEQVEAALALDPDVPSGAPQADPDELARLQHGIELDQADLDAQARQFLEEVMAEDAVLEAMERPQPGDERATIAQFPEGHPEREVRRREWLETLDENFGFRSYERMQQELGIEGPHTVRQDRVLTLILGQPAAGKSTLANPVVRDTNAMLVDSDEAKALIPEFEGGQNAGGVHEESGMIADRLLTRVAERGDNIVFPTVGKSLRKDDGSGLLDVVDLFREAGYQVHVLLNEVPAVEAARRAHARFESTGRFVDYRYIIEGVGQRPQQNYAQVRAYDGVTSAQRWSNDVQFGEPPVFLEANGLPPEGLSPTRIAQEVGAGTGGSRGRATTDSPGRPPAAQAQVPGPGAALPGGPGGGVAAGPQTLPLAAPRRGRPGELQVQEDVFGERQVTGDPQADLFPDQDPEGLSSAEAQARRTVESLRPFVEAGVASNVQLETYQEALSLLRRDEMMNEEEVTTRARRLEQEERQIDERRQGELFELRPQERVPAESQDLTLPHPWQQSLEEYAGAEPTEGDRARAEWTRQQRLWSQSVLEAVSEGKLSVEDAQARGWEPPFPEGMGREFRRMPEDQPLYHVTTSRSGVADVGLKTPAQLGVEHGPGLAGRKQSGISFTTSLEAAQEIQQAFLLARSYLRGETSTEQLLQWARDGDGGRGRPWHDQLVRLYGREWSPGEPYPGELQAIIDGTVDALEPRFELLQRWFAARSRIGGIPTPNFFQARAEDLRDLHPREVSIVEARPAGGAQGIELGGPRQEWQTYSGRAVEVRKIDGQDPATLEPPTSPMERGWAKAKIREEMAKELPLEPRAADVLPDTPAMAREGAEEAPSLSQIREDMERTLGVPIRVGRLRRLAHAFGLYQVQPEVVRTRMANDITTIAHEIGHHMHKLLFVRDAPSFDARRPTVGMTDSQLQPWRSELMPIAEAIGQESLTEGWAEFWRRWVTNRPQAEQAAPRLTEWLTARLQERHPDIWDGLQRWQRMMGEYASASPAARVMSRLAYGEGFIGRMREKGRRGIRRIYQEVLDKYAPLEEAQRELDQMRPGQPIDDAPVNVDQMPKIMADLIAGSAGMADHFITRGPVDFRTGQPRDDAPSLAGALAPILDHLEHFETYIVARRAHHLQTERELDQGFETADLEATMQDLEHRFPEFREASDQLHAFQEAVLDYVVDGGVITRETADAFREGNPFYVPLYKVVDPEMKGNAGTGTGRNDHIFSPFKRIGNSARDIVPPLESIIKNTFFYTELVQKQRVQAALADMASLEGAGEWIRPIEPGNVVAAKVPSKEITDWMRRKVEEELLGTPATRLDADFLGQVEQLLPEMFAVWRPGDFFGQENVISHLQTIKDPKTGETRQERFWYEVDEEIYRALTYTPQAGRNLFMRMLSFPARMLRAGATLAPEFLGRNPFRDQPVGFIQAEYGYTPGIDLAKGLFHVLGKTEQYWHFKRSGGEFATLVDMDRDATVEGIRKLMNNPVQNVIKHPFQGLQALAATMENATRMGEYLNVIRAGGEKQGIIQRWRNELDPQWREQARERERQPPRHLQDQAAWHAREVSVQYSTHGASDSVQIIRLLNTFWNARVQGYKRLWRAFREHPTRSTVRSLASITLPTLMLYAINREDEEYWELPQWQRDWFWLVRVPNPMRDVVPDALTADPADSGAAGTAMDFLGGRFGVQPFVNEGETVWLRFPIPWELGLVFKTLPERILEWMDTQDPEGLQESLRTSFWQQVPETVMPIPTAVEPLVENWANYSFFLQRNIDPIYEGAHPAFVRRPGTSEVATGMAAMLHDFGAYNIPGMEKLAGSPQKIDNALWSWTGGLGRLAIDVVDESAMVTGLTEREERRPPTIADVPGIRGFVARAPGLNSESVQRFRRRWRRIDQTKQTINLLEREERWEQLERELEDPEVREHLQQWPEYNRVNARLSAFYSEASQVEKDPALTDEQKLEQLQRIGEQATRLARETIGRELPGDRPFFFR